jgi:hypothetical protein
MAAGEPLLAAAQRAGEVRDDVTLEQALDLTIAVAKMPGQTTYIEAILQIALDGLRADVALTRAPERGPPRRAVLP